MTFSFKSAPRSRMSKGPEFKIRCKIHSRMLRKSHRSKRIRVIDELGLNHPSGKLGSGGRIDIAVVAETQIYGIEIKSKSDSLARLKRQVDLYRGVFSRMTLACDPKFTQKSRDVIPDWWKITECTEGARGGVALRQVRSGGVNPDVSQRHCLELLWRFEVLRIVVKRHKLLESGYGYTVGELRDIAAQRLSDDVLSKEICWALRVRKNWRLDKYLPNAENPRTEQYVLDEPCDLPPPTF